VKRFIVMGLLGGLGNQLFQYASGYGIARRLDAELLFDGARIDENWLPTVLGSRYRPASKLQLVRLGVFHGQTRARDAAARHTVATTVSGVRRLRHLTPATMPVDCGEPDIARYDDSLFAVDLPTHLLGYFQSERWFADVADEVVASLRLPDPELSRPHGSRPVVALSFRRGDYVRQGWELPFSYYEHALDRLLDAVPEATFLVFGDDREFVRLAIDWVARYGPARNAYDLATGVLDHLVLASRCDHAVIANSSFAWWGAWLGDRRHDDPARLVLAPEAYAARFGPDILPRGWVPVPS
jgi:hypothetical protein